MKLTLSQLKNWINGATLSTDTQFDGISTDTRQVSPGNLFIALKGENFDAHDFLADLVNKRPAAVIVERLPQDYPIPALIVPDTRLAMAEIASHWREQFTMPVIAVTGSNGKTTTKEMIAAILKAAHGQSHVLATKGNLNNDLGVPMTLFSMQKGHTVAVVELGMNHPGEIDYLAKIAQPTIALVNNAQREHQEFMQSVEAVAKENGSVFTHLPNNGTAVFPFGDTYTTLWSSLAGNRKQMTFGLSPQADIHASWQTHSKGTQLSLCVKNQTVSFVMHTSGEHNVKNALAASACAYAAGISLDAIVKGLESFVPVNGRLQRKVAFNGAQIIDDTYNANPDSVRAAIDVLSQMKNTCFLVLADMGEVGENAQQYHEEVGAYAKEKGIAHLYTFGQTSQAASRAYGPGAHHFETLESLIDTIKTEITTDTTVLVKGSRFMHMERVVDALVNSEKKEGC